jgi:hypothetical protein
VLASAPAKYEVLCSLIRALVDSITMNGCTTDIGATINSRNLCLATPHIAVERTFGQTWGFSRHDANLLSVGRRFRGNDGGWSSTAII